MSYYLTLMKKCMLANGHLLTGDEISLISIGWKDQPFTTSIIQTVDGIHIEQVDINGMLIQHPNPDYMLMTDDHDLYGKITRLCLDIANRPVLNITDASNKNPVYVVHHRDVLKINQLIEWLDRIVEEYKPVSYQLPAGQYYIGDFANIVADQVYCLVACADGVFTTPKGKFFVHRTRQGDGIFNDNDGNDYIVDSGVLSVVPSTLYEKQSFPSMLSGKKITRFEDLGSIQNFTGEITVGYDPSDGTFTISSPKDNLEIIIRT